MGFFLSKLIIALAVPPASLLALVVAGLLLARRRPRLGRGLVIAGLALLYLLSLGPVSDLLIRPLESAAPPFDVTAFVPPPQDGGDAAVADPTPAAQPRPDAVVVLGGGIRDLAWVPAPPEPSEGSTERLVAGVALARALDLPLVISGGTGDPRPGPGREADAMAAVAERLGFPPDRILKDNDARNTLENAAFVAKLIPGRRVVLVTSASHMRRASGMFRKQGFTVLPAPTGYRSHSRPVSVFLLVPNASAFATSATALTEYISLTWYSLIGKA